MHIGTGDVTGASRTWLAWKPWHSCCAASVQAVGRSRILLQELWQVQLADGCLDGLDGDRRAQLLHRLLLEANHLIGPRNCLAGLQMSSRIYQSSEGRREGREWLLSLRHTVQSAQDLVSKPACFEHGQTQHT